MKYVMKQSKVIAVIVTYNPIIEVLENLFSMIIPQVFQVVIIDNASRNSDDIFECCTRDELLKIIRLEHNFGIGYAQNEGIEYAYENSADYVLLLDQDSIPSVDMVTILLDRANTHKSATNAYPAAVGPCYIDSRTKCRSFFMTSRYGIPHKSRFTQKPKAENSIAVSFLISSGCLIEMQALIEHGGMRGEYFIDHVDTEWCLRMKHNGKTLIGEHDAVMEHTLGDENRRIWFLYMRSISYHTPLRDYYMFRNTLLLIHDVRLSLSWKIYMIVRLLQCAGYFLIFAKSKIERFRYMMMGIKHGLMNIRGKLDTNTYECKPIPKTRFDPK